MGFKGINARLALSSLLAVLALSAIVASAAQASVESPYFKVGGARLEAGASKELKATGKGNYVITDATVSITCTKMSAAAGSKILGSAGGKAGTAEAAFTFSSCSASGGGGECKITEIKTQPLVGTLVLNDGKTYVEMLLKPAKGKVFGKVEDEGKETECGLLGSEIRGELVVSLESGEKEEAIQVGKEPAEAHTVDVHVPYPPGSVFEESAFVEVEALTDFGHEMTVAGNSKLELAGGALWGVFT
jgi:hypothetical protein